MANQRGSKGSGRTLSDADIAALAKELRNQGVGAPAGGTSKSGQKSGQKDSPKLEEQLMRADHLLAKTFGPTGRLTRHGEASIIPPARPKRLVMLREGHRKPNPQPAKLQSARVTSQARAKVKSPHESNVPFPKSLRQTE